ncbi:hypothetical protein JCM8547_002807 [Rhodosporidiobolus lusitaniae]
MAEPDRSAPSTASIDLPAHATSDLDLIFLLADTPIPEVQEKYGTYHDIFAALFERAVKLAADDGAVPGDSGYEKSEKKQEGGHKLNIQSYNAVDGHLPSEERVKKADGILITGSASNAHDDLPWIKNLINFVRKLPSINADLKVMGICFGHQIVTQAYGGTCGPSEKGWEIGTRKLRLTERGKEVFPGHDLHHRLGVHQMHRDVCPEVPEGFDLLASTHVCPNHGSVKFVDPSAKFSLRNIAIITLQGHPEFNATIVNTLIDVREERGVIPKEIGEASREYSGDHDDGNYIARRFLGMFGI